MGFEDITGQKFGKFTVIGIHPDKTSDNHYNWVCKCECGNIRFIRASVLKSGNSQTCGCYRKRFNKTKNREYYIWVNMKTRCYNKNNKGYSDYGGRGITICDRWLKSYENFITDMDKRPSSKHSIDRIDNDKGYSPENCRWSTSKEQNRNRRSNHYIEVEDIYYTITQFCELLQITTNMFYYYYSTKNISPLEIFHKFKEN